MFRRMTAVVLLTLCLTPASHAIDWFIGAELGYVSFDANGEIQLPEADDKDLMFGFNWGMPIDEFFTLEFSYQDFGTFEQEYPFTGEHLEFSPKSLGISTSFFLPVNEQMKAFATVGIEKWDAKISGNNYDVEDGTDPFYGLGLSFNLQPDLDLSLEGTKRKWDGSDGNLEMNTVQLGLRYFY